MSSIDTSTDEAFYWVHSLSTEGFHPDPDWLIEQKRIGVACSECENVHVEKTKSVSNVVVSEVADRDMHCGKISGLGIGQVISKVLIDSVGRREFSEAGRLVPILLKGGGVCDSHELFIANRIDGWIRGPSPHDPGLCRECHSILYWPGWPPRMWYLLRQYLTGVLNVATIGPWFLMRRSVYESSVAPKKLKKLAAERIRIADKPEDGLPADFKSFFESLRSRPK